MTQATDGAAGLWGCPSQVTKPDYFGDTHISQAAEVAVPAEPKEQCPGQHLLVQGIIHPARMAENEELLLICKQMLPVLLLGGGSSCTLLAG